MTTTSLAVLRRSLPTILLLVGASALLLATDRATSRRTMPAIAVLQQVSTTLLDDAVAGMLEGLAERGFVDGRTVTVRRYNAEGDLAQANAIAREIVGGAFDLALTSSTPSLQALATANERGRILHVFAAVADPFSAGVGLDRSNPLVHPRHLVGYGSLAPVDATFRIAQTLNPSLTRVGVAHNPAESNSRRYMELTRACCTARQIELLEAAVENSSGVIEAIQSTIARGAEAIFVPGDTTVSSVIDSIIATASKAGVPVFTVVPGKPGRGTLFDVGFDFREVGLLAGRVAGDLLAGTDPSTVPIRETTSQIPPRLSVNVAAPGYDRGRWRVPDELLRQAKLVIDDRGRRDQPDAVFEGPFDEPGAPADKQAAGSAAVSSPAPAKPSGGKSAGPLRVGMELSYPPFEMTDKQGRPTGVSVRLADALGEFLGREVVIENISFDGLIPALKTNKIDCVISSMTATPERSKSIAFSAPYLRTGLALLVAAKSPVESAADLDAAGRVVAVKKGTTGHQWAATNLAKARVLVLDKESAGVLEVAQGKADAFIYDPLSIFQNHKRHADTTRAILRPFREETWAVGLRIGDDALRRQVDGFLEDFRDRGGFEKLGDEFLAEEKAYFREHDIPFFF